MDSGIVVTIRFTSIDGVLGQETEFRLPRHLISPVSRFTGKRATEIQHHLAELGFPDEMKISPRDVGPYHGKRGDCVLSVTVATKPMTDMEWRDGKWLSL